MPPQTCWKNIKELCASCSFPFLTPKGSQELFICSDCMCPLHALSPNSRNTSITWMCFFKGYQFWSKVKENPKDNNHAQGKPYFGTNSNDIPLVCFSFFFLQRYNGQLTRNILALSQTPPKKKRLRPFIDLETGHNRRPFFRAVKRPPPHFFWPSPRLTHEQAVRELPQEVALRGTAAQLVPTDSRLAARGFLHRNCCGSKIGTQEWHPGRRKHGLKPAVPWWFKFDPQPNGETKAESGTPVCWLLRLKTSKRVQKQTRRAGGEMARLSVACLPYPQKGYRNNMPK